LRNGAAEALQPSPVWIVLGTLRMLEAGCCWLKSWEDPGTS